MLHDPIKGDFWEDRGGVQMDYIYQKGPTSKSQMEIVQALEKLMHDVPYESLTVSQICREARLSRQTFYRYFPDKFAIAHWHFNHIADSTLYQTGRTLNWFEAFYETNYLFVGYRSIYKKVLRQDHGYHSLTSFAFRKRKESLIETIVDYKKVDLSPELKFQVEYLAHAETQIITRWAKHDMDIGARELAQLETDAVPRKLFTLLNVPVNPRPANMPIL